MRNYKLTKYPKIFKKTNWGGAKVGTYAGHGPNHKDIIYENRNAFVEEYNIKSFVSELPTGKQNMIDHFKDKHERNERFLDHFERYRTTSNKIICIASPYISEDDPELKHFLLENNFKLFKPMYSSSASTFIIDVSDGFNKENKIQTLHKFMKVLEEDPTISPNFKYEPLHTAIELNQVDVVKSLLNHPMINVNKIDQEYETPLYIAIDNYQTDIVMMLLEHELIDPNNKNEYTISPLELCYKKDNMDCFKLLLQHPRTDPNMNYLVMNFDLDIVQYSTMLHHAIETRANVATELLLQHPRIDLNVKNEYGQRELHSCIHYKNTFALNLLLNHPRVDVNLINTSGQTVLHACFENSSPDLEFLQILVKHPRININKENEYRSTVLHCIVENSRRFSEKQNIFNIMLENPSFDINIRDNNNQTALDFACSFHKPEWVHLLLSHSSLEDAQRTYDTLVFYYDDDDDNDEIVSILNNFIEKEKKEDRFLTEKFCSSMIQPYVATQLKRKNPFYIGEDLVKDISSYLQWSDISKKKKKEMKIYFEDFPSFKNQT